MVECFQRQPSPVPDGEPGVEQAVGDVVEDRGVLGEEELLEHEPDPRRPQRGQLAVGELGDVEVGDTDRAARRTVERADDLQQRRLARTRWPDDGDQLAGQDLQAQRPQRRHRRFAVVDLRHAEQLENRATLAVALAGRADGRGHRRVVENETHVAGTTTCWPTRSSVSVTWTSPSESSNRPSLTGTIRRMPEPSSISTA